MTALAASTNRWLVTSISQFRGSLVTLQIGQSSASLKHNKTAHVFTILSWDLFISSSTQTDEYWVVYEKLENVPVVLEGLPCPPTAILAIVTCTVPKPPRTCNSCLRVLRTGTRRPKEQILPFGIFQVGRTARC